MVRDRFPAFATMSATADRLELRDHMALSLRCVALAMAVAFGTVLGLVLAGDGGDVASRVWMAMAPLALLVVMLGYGLGTRLAVLDRPTGTVRTAFRLLGRDVFARSRALAEFSRIRAYHVRGHREWSYRLALVGPGGSVRIHRSGIVAPARDALAAVVAWLDWPVDDEVGLATPARGPQAKP